MRHRPKPTPRRPEEAVRGEKRPSELVQAAGADPGSGDESMGSASSGKQPAVGVAQSRGWRE